MPFERYLADDHAIDNQDHRHAYDDADCHYAHGQHLYLPETTAHYNHHHAHAVQLQIPQFMLNGPPILAPGGGAEVLPAGLLDSGTGSFGSSWFANNGFAPLRSALISRQITSGSVPDSSSIVYHTFPPDGSQRLPSNYPPRFTASVDPRQQPLPEPPPSLKLTTAYISKLATSPSSIGSSNTTSYAFSNALVPDPIPSLSVTVPSTLGLPVYSASGFDVISILSRVVNRLNPTVQLGPVDLSCSFVIVDVRRYDCPIVYASPTFCHLTGYSEQEVLGRNCRFLQSPTGNVAKGEPRRFASPEAVSHMRKLLSSSKECQTTLVNYRKGGQAFINLVTVIPLRGGVHNMPEEADEVAYHIGFQVDLTEQPNRILDKLRDGSYCVNNGSWGTTSVASNAGLRDMSHGLSQLTRAQNMTNIGPKGGRHGQMMSIAVSKDLRNLIADTTFTDSVSISTRTNMSGSTGASSGAAEQGSNATTPLTMLITPPPSSTSMNRMSASGNTPTAGSIPVSVSPALSLLLLEFLPDFLLVLSLKGAFLYVAPSVRLVLGYEPQELVGRSISDVCHPADLVPLMRELKEGSVSGLGIPGTSDVGSSTGAASNLLPKSVDLLFRALPKASPSSEAQDTSAELDDFHHSQLSSVSASQSPLSSETLCSNDSSNGTTPPYVWLECRGRLHVEPGKGRKAIILSGRARWMPVVRWGSIDKTGGVGSVRCQREDTQSGSRKTTGSRLSETSPGEAAGGGSMDPLEFWALLSSQGTFLVASASVRDVLGWGTSEVIGRSVWAMVRDSRTCSMRERVEAELAKLDTPEVKSMVDPPPTVVTTSLVHKESHVVPVRLVFYRTPRSHKYAPPLTSSPGVTSTPLIHPLNNPLCPIVCQATVLRNTEYPSSNNIDTRFGPSSGHAPSQVQIQKDIGDDTDESGFFMHHSDASLFGELETGRGSSWQYELQQLKFANQRLHEELNALEGARASSGALAVSSSNTIGTGHTGTVPLGQPCSSSPSTAAIPIPQLPQTQLHYTPLMHSILSTSLSPLHPPNSLHDQDPPSSEWSSLAGANGQGPNPLKRSWRSEDGPMA
ncbi:hypothetical protein J3R82DRAFT_6853 [Butyriboletus roseoflavus]|nr:hypothetical protein J3R82DRAFT_6853 [Butyriboletus roseoflavus]